MSAEVYLECILTYRESMTKEQKANLLSTLYRFLRRKLSLFMIACMLGISNVILEEDRLVNDTRAKIEQQDMQPEDEFRYPELF